MKEATGLNVVGVEDDGVQRNEWETCPGTRMPSTHRSTLVDGTFCKGKVPVLFLHINVRLVGEPINTVMLTQVLLVILTFMFESDPRIKSKERWEK
jgi:hypothetical protein